MPDSGQTSSTRGSVSWAHVSSRTSAGSAPAIARSRVPVTLAERGASVHVGRVDGLGREPGLLDRTAGTTDEADPRPASVLP